MAQSAFEVDDDVEYRFASSGPFVGAARIVEVLSDGRYRLARLDGAAFPLEGSIFVDEQLRLRATEPVVA